ncbi:cytochrome P450 [Actinophytocola sp.]|uniref:cytochrome P450 n=1 Tax=Actinophytocola sp. TaxID=1872138 RepID=UPI002D4D265D|nr:cytochrome P450 [Actinophytocola sp.]HYQ68138.1 cytochrome P450 [Actinophytocola sp.]
MRAEELLDAPHVDVPTVPAPVDCMPSLVAAGRTAPVVKVDYYGGTAWAVCDMDLVRTALTDRRLSKDIELTPEWMRVPGVMLGSQPRADVARTMVMSEGPAHARIRRLHARIFTPRNTEEWGARLVTLAETLLAELTGEVNLVEHYTYPLPLGFICEMLGLPAELHPVMRRATDDIIYSPDQAVRTAGVGALAGAVAGWAADPGPLRDGLITGLIADESITLDEVVTWTVGLVMAGYESTASLIAAAILEALRRPPDRRPRTEAEIDRWIEETLRVHPPFPHATWRFATEDVDLGGYLIPRGAPVQINVAAANRCPHADDFDPDAARDHISFGLGHHYCLGAPLARLEARVALSAFLPRFPHARLSGTTEVRWESEWMTRRISVLPVVLDDERYDR